GRRVRATEPRKVQRDRSPVGTEQRQRVEPLRRARPEPVDQKERRIAAPGFEPVNVRAEDRGVVRRDHVVSPNNVRAMISFWISLVPPPMASSFASRIDRSTENSLM